MNEMIGLKGDGGTRCVIVSCAPGMFFSFLLLNFLCYRAESGRGMRCVMSHALAVFIYLLLQIFSICRY